MHNCHPGLDDHTHTSTLFLQVRQLLHPGRVKKKKKNERRGREERRKNRGEEVRKEGEQEQGKKQNSPKGSTWVLVEQGRPGRSTPPSGCPAGLKDSLPS